MLLIASQRQFDASGAYSKDNPVNICNYLFLACLIPEQNVSWSNITMPSGKEESLEGRRLVFLCPLSVPSCGYQSVDKFHIVLIKLVACFVFLFFITSSSLNFQSIFQQSHNVYCRF